MQEMEARMRNMEKMYTRRLMAEVQQNEMKMDEKLDMLQNSGLLAQQRPIDSDSEDDNGAVLEDIDEESEVNESIRSEYSQDDEDDEDASESELSRSPSPLAGKAKPKTSSIKPIPRQPSPDEESEIETEPEAQASDDQGESDDEMEEWPSPSPAEKKAEKAEKAGPSGYRKTKPPSPVFDNEGDDSDEIEDLEDELDALSLAPAQSRDSIAVIPNKQARQKAVAVSKVEYVPRVGEVDVIVKPKRQLKRSGATAKDKVEEGSLRRSTRISRS